MKLHSKLIRKAVYITCLFLIACIATGNLAGVSQHYNRALYLFEQNVLLEAEREIKTYLREFPEDYEANKLLAKILSRLGEFNELRELLVKLRRMRPDDRELQEIEERLQAERRKTVLETTADLEAALRTDPNSVDLRLRLIAIYETQRRFTDADRLYREVLQLRPNDSAFRLRYARFLAQRGRIREAEAQYVIYLRAVNNETVRRELFSVLLQDAHRLISEQKFDEAVEGFQNVVERYPDDLFLLREYAKLLSWAKRFDQSIVVYRRYLEVNDTADARLEMARVISWKDDYAGALTEILLVLEAEPENIQALILLGDIYRWTDNMDDAKEKYDYVLTIEPDNMYALEGLKELEKLEQIRYQQASAFSIDAMRKAIAEDSTNLFARVQLARLLNIAAEYNEAAKHYEIYLKEKPEHTAVRLEYSRTLSSMGNYRGAIQQLLAYLKENPRDLTNRLNLVNLYLWSEDYRNGENLLKEIIQDYPENIYSRWTLVRFYRNREDWDDALYHLDAILEIEPNYTVAIATKREIENHPRYRYQASGPAREPSPYRPSLGFSYGYMRDHENYSEKFVLFRYIQPLKSNSQLELSFGRYFLNQKMDRYNNLGNLVPVTYSVENDRYTLTFSTGRDDRSNANVWIGMNNYTGKYEIDKTSSFFLGGSVSYQIDELNTVSIGYLNDDAVYLVKTVLSLGGVDYVPDPDATGVWNPVNRAAIGLDMFNFGWERKAVDEDPEAPLLERLTFFGRAGYAMLTDRNKRVNWRVGASYPVMESPEVNFLIGWDSVHFSETRPTEMYWTPQNHQGPYFGGSLNGRWQDFTYGVDAEISFKRDTIGASRSISGKLYYLLSERLTAGVILSYSESPREDDTDYNFMTSILELYYRF